MVQQAWRVTVNAPTVEEGASLAISRWCQSSDCGRRATLRCCHPCCCCHRRRHYPLPLPLLPLLGVGARSRRRTQRLLMRWAWLLLLWLRRVPSSRGRGVGCGGLSLGHRVVQLDVLEFEVIADSVGGGERLRPFDEDLHMIKLLVHAL
jgi:hypothetical protein